MALIKRQTSNSMLLHSYGIKKALQRLKMRMQRQGNQKIKHTHYIGKNSGTIAQQNSSSIEHHSILHVIRPQI
jgi:hypothetical protein